MERSFIFQNKFTRENDTIVLEIIANAEMESIMKNRFVSVSAWLNGAETDADADADAEQNLNAVAIDDWHKHCCRFIE